MAFDAGTRVGPYEILAPLGAGGMGEVYRARDTRLDRTVAIKVLTGATAADPEARARFEQEARAIAALNHPHICILHDVGRHGDLDYLVLEYLEGETLAERLRRSPPLTRAEILDIAIQIGDALDRAHREGIAHRDLKPGNVMLVRHSRPSHGAEVKLLDFGLAARTPVRPVPAANVPSDDTLSPSMVATRPPTVVAVSGFSGTLHYMSPEQLDGDPGDHRADIFAFGCLLYEMLAGRKAFEGGSLVTVIAAIMSSEPPPLPASQHAERLLDHVLRRCLDKDRERRWQSIADVTGELTWLRDHPVADSPAAVLAGRRFGAWTWAAAAAGAVLTIAVILPLLLFGGMRWIGLDQDDATPVLQFEIATPPTDDPSGALSPDGSKIAFVADHDRVPALWVRGLDSVENRLLPGTNGATFPFWSPDGRTIGFFADAKLKRIEASGGMPLVLADAPTARGGAWNRDGVILFAPGVSAPIMRVPSRGGKVEAVTSVNGSSGPSHRWPQFLPDGRRFLFSSSLGAADTNGIYVGSLDRSPPVRLLPDDGSGRYAPPDRLLTIKQGALQAYRFDAAAARVTGEPTILAQGMTDAAANGVFATSETGLLAYRAGATQRRQLVWVDRHGTVLRPIGDPQTNSIASPELSPDEQSVTVFLHPYEGGDNDVWVIELARNLARPITTGPPADAHPFWDPDGRHVIFNSRRSGVPGPTRFPLDGGAPEPLFPPGQRGGVALSSTGDRHFLLLRRDDARTGVDLVAVSTTGDGIEVAVTQAAGDETEGQFSPDGTHVAFVGNGSGRPEVYVQSFPDGRGRTQVSIGGGTQVRWSRDGKEIFYIAPDSRLMAVTVAFHGAATDVTLPLPLFQTHLATGVNVIGNKAQYAVARDGRFLLNSAIESASAPIVVSVTWMKKLPR